MPEPQISVIIPHLNQEEFLERCLGSLVDQQGRKDVEIIVVDNGSAELPSKTVGKFEYVKLIEEPEAGPGPARNKGVYASSADILAFIDADCLAHADWIDAIFAKLSAAGSNMIVGGDVQIALAQPGRKTMLEAYESVYAYRQQEYIERHGFSGTGNLAMRRHVFEAVGKFAGISVAEDIDWGRRAIQAGFTIHYVPEMIVYHPARTNFEELFEKWDRHIAHEFETESSGFIGKIRWFARASGVLISPMFEIVRIWHSRRLTGTIERFHATQAVIRIRIYRSLQMLQIMFSSDTRARSHGWNRKK